MGQDQEDERKNRPPAGNDGTLNLTIAPSGAGAILTRASATGERGKTGEAALCVIASLPEGDGRHRAFSTWQKAPRSRG